MCEVMVWCVVACEVVVFKVVSEDVVFMVL